ncbi:MAG: hypothetical protein MJZ66_11570, partial [Bacteroidales bacterium]|nr:hypothetical protein [Bacteroidales bacterium]
MKRYIYIFTLVILAAVSACHPYDRAIPEKYIATWTNNGAIELGLYEEVAIYKNDFWDYDKVEKDGDKLSLTLRNGDRKENISVSLSDNKEELQVSGNGSISTLSKNAFIYDPSKADTDTTSFCEYKDVPDSATVIIYFRKDYQGLGNYLNNLNKTGEVLYYRNYNEYKQFGVQNKNKDDHFGYRYEYKVPVHCVTENFDIINGRYLSDWDNYSSYRTRYLMEPGDTLVIVKSGKDLFVGGSNARINNEMAQYGRFIWGVECGFASIASATTHGYHDLVDSLPKMKQIDLDKFNDFCTQNGANISNKFKQYITHEIEYLNAIRVMEHSEFKDSLISNFKIDESTVFTNSAEWEYNTAVIELAYRNKLNVSTLPALYFADTKVMQDMGLSDLFIDRFVYRGLVQLQSQDEMPSKEDI